MKGILTLFEDKEFNKKLKKLMIPIAFQNLMLNAVTFGDTLMLGFVNQESLAAVSLASQVYFVMTLFIGTLTGGATVLSAQYLGKKDRKTVECVYCSILRYAAVISMVFFGLTAFLPEYLMHIFTNEAEMIVIGAEYLRISSVSYLFAGISQCYLCMMKVDDRAKEATTITTSIVFLDLILNAIFIFGLLGFPAMGIKGAALTTVISKGVELLIVVVYSEYKKLLRPDFKGMFVVKPKLESEFWNYSFPIFLNEMAWGGGVTIYSIIIGHLGTDATSANSIVTVVKNIIICMSIGMGNASGIVLGKELGENNLELGREYGKRFSKIAILLGFVSAILILICGPIAMSFFRINEITRAYLQWMLVWCAINSIGRCINDTVICGIFAAGGDTKFDAQSLIVTMWGFIIPLALCAAFWWKLPVIWVCFILNMDEVIKVPWVFAHYKKYIWVKNITKDSEW